jgi:hypothetical protein
MIVDGRHVPVAFPVRYRWGLRVPKKRSGPPNGVVVHHPVTAGADATFRVLVQRGLGTHFEVERDGTVYQYADPVRDVMYHASEQNGSKIGVDMTGPDFTDVQLRRTAELIRALAAEIGFPIATADWSQRGYGPEQAGVLAHHQTAGGVSSGKIDPSGAVDGVGKLGGPEVWQRLQALLG